jgi:hypothetical protein
VRQLHSSRRREGIEAVRGDCPELGVQKKVKQHNDKRQPAISSKRVTKAPAMIRHRLEELWKKDERAGSTPAIRAQSAESPA